MAKVTHVILRLFNIFQYVFIGAYLSLGVQSCTNCQGPLSDTSFVENLPVKLRGPL